MPPPPTGYQPLPPAYGINPPSMMAPNMPSAFDSGSNLASMGMSAGGTTPQNLHNPNPMGLASSSGDSAGQQAPQPGASQVKPCLMIDCQAALLLSIWVTTDRVRLSLSSMRWTSPSNATLSSCVQRLGRLSAIRYRLAI